MTGPKLIAVAAVTEDYAIAEESGLPWDTNNHDLRRYQHRVWGSPIIVGRTTYESLLRYNNAYIYESPAAVLTTNQEYETSEDFHTIVHSKEEALEWAEDRNEEVVYNLGGGQVYDLLFDELDEIVLSHMQVTSQNPTAFFPKVEEDDWEIVSKECFPKFTLIRYNSRGDS